MAKKKEEPEKIDLVKLHALPKDLKGVSAVTVHEVKTIEKRCPTGDE